jgi:alkylhydroperoxidase family enzyme
MIGRHCPQAGILSLVVFWGIATGGASGESLPGGPPGARVPLLDSPEAWKRLPPAEQGGGGPLPSWARALAGALPHTTAAMLELDAVYRGAGDLDPRFRAALRWVVARENRSGYGQAVAEADYRRAGAEPRALQQIAEPRGGWAEPERAAFAVARKMALAAHTVTDAEVKHLADAFGEKQLVAIVLQIAYGNFQDRLTTLLGLPAEEADTQAPLAVRFKKPAGLDVKIPAARRPKPAGNPAEGIPLRVEDKGWTDLDIRRLKASMEDQRARPPRVRVPSWDEVFNALPPGTVPRDKPNRVRWSLVVLGYQPKQGPAWLRCLRSFGAEAKQDRVLEESIFWVITRNLQCFY